MTRITIYDKTWEQAILENDTLTDEDIALVEEQFSSFIKYVVDELTDDDTTIDIQPENHMSAGPIYSAYDDLDNVVELSLPDFWDFV